MNEKPSFESFFLQFYDSTFRYVQRKIGHHQEAEDLTCDAFFYCYNHFSEYDPDKASIGTWLYLIVNSRIKNYYRDRKDFASIDNVQDVLPDDSVYMDKALELEDTRKMIAAGLKTLSPVQREIVILRYFHEYDTASVADKLGLKPGNVRTILSRALNRLEQYCRMHGME